MESPQELFMHGQRISTQLSIELDDSYLERVDMAYAISCISNCSLRVRKVSESDETFHVISRFYDSNQSKQLPYFSVTFERQLEGEQFDVSLGFVVQSHDFVSFQAEGCFECGDEEFCSQQPFEKSEDDFNFLAPILLETITRYCDLWSPIIADFASSYGVEYMYENVPYILDQVFDSWSDIPNELESTYTDFEFNSATNMLEKNPHLCSKDECSADADSFGLCYMHEDTCRMHDCFDYKSDGLFCYLHTE